MEWWGYVLLAIAAAMGFIGAYGDWVTGGAGLVSPLPLREALRRNQRSGIAALKLLWGLFCLAILLRFAFRA